MVRVIRPLGAPASLSGIEMLSLDALRGEHTRKAVAYWSKVRKTQPLPLLADFNPAEIQDLLAHVVVLDAAGPTPEFTFRILGGETKQMFGIDLTGQRLAALARCGQDFYDGALKLYGGVCERRTPLAVFGDLSGAGPEALTYEAVLLPFTREGAQVDRIIEVVDAVPREEA